MSFVAQVQACCKNLLETRSVVVASIGQWHNGRDGKVLDMLIDGKRDAAESDDAVVLQNAKSQWSTFDKLVADAESAVKDTSKLMNTLVPTKLTLHELIKEFVHLANATSLALNGSVEIVAVFED